MMRAPTRLLVLGALVLLAAGAAGVEPLSPDQARAQVADLLKRSATGGTSSYNQALRSVKAMGIQTNPVGPRRG